MGKTRYVASYWVATIHAGLGQVDQAMTCVERAYEEHSDRAGDVSVDPRLDGLRSDPRFAELKRMLGLGEHPPAGGVLPKQNPVLTPSRIS